MFCEQHALPEEVDAARPAGDVVDGHFERSDGAAADAEDFEELVPEGLGFGVFLRCVRPFGGKADGVLADFVPTEGHGQVQIFAENLLRRKRRLQSNDNGTSTMWEPCGFIGLLDWPSNSLTISCSPFTR